MLLLPCFADDVAALLRRASALPLYGGAAIFATITPRYYAIRS